MSCASHNSKTNLLPSRCLYIARAHSSPEVLVTYTKDLGQILQAIHAASSKVGGVADITTAIAVAQLALKHRQNKNLRQRIVVFVGSPLEGQSADERNMIRLAKKLKKNNVAVDVIAFGDGIEEGEGNVLRTFVENANSGDNSYVTPESLVNYNIQIDLPPSCSRHYVAVPPGPHLLSDIILSSPILAGDGGIPEEAMGDAAPAAGGGQFEFGVDPSLDPELAMVRLVPPVVTEFFISETPLFLGNSYHSYRNFPF